VVSEGNRYGGQRHGGDYEGTAGREGFGPHRYDVARYVKVARRKVVQGELRSGRHGEFGRVLVGFGKSRIGSIR